MDITINRFKTELKDIKRSKVIGKNSNLEEAQR